MKNLKNMKNFSYTIKEGEHAGETLWSGRYCAVAAFVFCKFPKLGWCVLANKRGEGTPDFQGMWNCPCGFLEPDENAKQACSRETYEETGVNIPACMFNFVEAETEPSMCNNGNVTLRHYAVLPYGGMDVSVAKKAVLNNGGEENEVEAIQWIPVNEMSKYEWAFNHLFRVDEIFNKFIQPNEQ